jgi:hypothetical protein
MKNMYRMIAASLVMAAFTTNSYAQSTANADASATIVTPISISKTADMSFGNVAVTATPGTVILAPAGTRSITGGVTLPAATGTVSAAAFTVTGTDTYTYVITLPSSITLTHSGGIETMTADAFTSNPLVAAGVLNSGTEDISVGATLHVAAAQLAGNYATLAPFDVTVNYN